MRPAFCFSLAACVMTICSVANARDYDPLAVSASASVEIIEASANDATHKRTIPLRIYLPSAKTPVPVVLFSHGLGGSNKGSAFLGKQWARRGYVAVFVQHPGSDEAVWKNTVTSNRMNALKKAADYENFMARATDIPAVLDALTVWNADTKHSLNGRLYLQHIGMSGHSFGAVTTQAVSGQQFGGKASLTDKRIDAAIAFSPSIPQRNAKGSKDFGDVQIPWCLMTGTEDNSPIGNADAASRRKVYAALAPGNKYQLVLLGAEHSAFTESALPGDKKPRNPNHHRAIEAISTAFWDAYLKGDAGAKKWLQTQTKTVLEAGDIWQTK